MILPNPPGITKFVTAQCVTLATNTAGTKQHNTDSPPTTNHHDNKSYCIITLQKSLYREQLADRTNKRT